MTVLKDAAEVARALVGLDRRYSNIPGCQSLKDQGRLGRAAEVCATFAGYDDPDYTVDLRGWRPASATIDGLAVPGITRVLQAEHNLLVLLASSPTPATCASYATPSDSSLTAQPNSPTRPHPTWPRSGEPASRPASD